MRETTWNIPDIFSENTEELKSAGYSPLLAAVLYARGLNTPEKAAAYLSLDKKAFSDPFGLEDMDKAVKRLERAISFRENVAIYGDYDVDGITASCLLCGYLRERGLNCRIYIPDRIDEGYGLNNEALATLRGQGVDLVITVDCGITAADNMEFAKGLGLDIIITDHHECPEVLPDCCAVINPKRHAPEHPAYNLAGVGVAMKLACALEGTAENILERFSDIAAVGTIADVMPLTGENRVLVHKGLEKLRNDPHPGLEALIIEAGAAEKTIGASIVGYTLAPRLNAAGRLCETSKSVELLMCANPAKSREYAGELCALNRRRQDLETEVWRDSLEELNANPPQGPIVLASENWHPGVVGIAASRLAEAYLLPAIIICLDGETGKGSCRSFGEFNLFDGLKACDEHLESFGGHAFAAGLNIKRDKIADFRNALSQYWAENMPRETAVLEPELQLYDFSHLTAENVESLDSLEPCGAGNPKPLICVCGVVIEELFEIGGGKHLRLSVGKNGQSVGGVFFGRTLDGLGVAHGGIADVCFTPQINDFRSRRSVQLLVAGIRPSPLPGLCRQALENPGALPEELEKTPLSREELAQTWRNLRGKGHIRRFGLGGLFRGTVFEGANPLKTCLSICVFVQLGLLALEFDGEFIEIEINEVAARASLEDSPLFCRLAQNNREE